MRKSRQRSILSIILCAAMLLPLFGNMIVSNAAGDTYCDWDTIAECRENQEAPVISGAEGKVFAGWYKDADYKNRLGANETVQGAYAKFVDSNALTIRYQETAGTTIVSKQTDLRLLTTVDSLNYQKVEFDIEVNGVTKTVESNKAYETIYGFTSDGVNSYTPDAAFECADSEYFMAFNLKEVPNSVFSTPITVTPKWTTLDGITVTGTSNTIIINEEISDTVTISNPNGDSVLYQDVYGDLSAGNILSFDIEFTDQDNSVANEAVGVWVLGEKKWDEYQYYARKAVAAGKETIAVVLPHDLEFVSIRINYTDTDGDTTDNADNVATISNISIGSSFKLQRDVESNAYAIYMGGDMRQGSPFSVNLDFEKDETIVVNLLQNNSWDGAPDYRYSDWTLSKTITTTIKSGTEYVRVLVRNLNDVDAIYNDNLPTISNVAVSDYIADASGKRVASHYIYGNFSKGQVVTFDVEFDAKSIRNSNGTFFMRIWGNGAWDKAYFEGETNMWLTKKQTFAVIIPESLTSLRVRMDYSGSDYQGVEPIISNIKISNSVTFQRTTEDSNSAYYGYICGSFSSTSTMSFDMTFPKNEHVKVNALVASGWTYGYESNDATVDWTAGKNISFKLNQNTNHVRVLFVYQNQDGTYTDNMPTISNIQVTP